MEQHTATTDRMTFPDTRNAVRVGLVGCGRLAQSGYLPAFQRTSEAVLVGVADVDLSRCREIAPGVPAYEGIHELIAAGIVDALIISTPTHRHLADAIAASQAKIPTLVEKPPGVDLHEAEALSELNPAPWIAFNRRFDPDLAGLRSRMPQSGKPDMRLELHYRRTAWNPFDMRDDALLDLGPHLIDLARWLTRRDIVSVRALLITDQRAEFELGLTHGRALVACSTNRPYSERLDLGGMDGVTGISYRRGGLLKGILARMIPKRDNPLVNSLVRQLDAFGLAVRRGSSESLAAATDGVAVMSAIEAIRRSAAEQGKQIRLENGAFPRSVRTA
ncbi:MAG TPA: Gfo/Idh/MocA family oxidoreductase [Nitrospira sp.]|nr:Gfo/Idh/MocA family oxidoreductase [Nitrospira sp.]